MEHRNCWKNLKKNLNTENKTRQKIKSFLAMNGYTLKKD